MSQSLAIANRQRLVSLNTRLLRGITKALLTDLLKLENFDLSIILVRSREMARINQAYLQHEGSTDIITFDYADNVLPASRRQSGSNRPAGRRKHAHGELFICLDDAITQAQEFRTTWQSELARYVIHGVLHLQGYDDIRVADRRKMKREENHLLREITRLFPLKELGSGPKLAA